MRRHNYSNLSLNDKWSDDEYQVSVDEQEVLTYNKKVKKNKYVNDKVSQFELLKIPKYDKHDAKRIPKYDSKSCCDEPKHKPKKDCPLNDNIDLNEIVIPDNKYCCVKEKCNKNKCDSDKCNKNKCDKCDKCDSDKCNKNKCDKCDKCDSDKCDKCDSDKCDSDKCDKCDSDKCDKCDKNKRCKVVLCYVSASGRLSANLAVNYDNRVYNIGDTVTFQYTIYNTGTSPLQGDVILQNKLSNYIETSIDIPVGGNFTLESQTHVISRKDCIVCGRIEFDVNAWLHIDDKCNTYLLIPGGTNSIRV